MPHLKRYKKFDKIEQQMLYTAQDPERLNKFWEILDVNGNNKVSLAEIDKLVVYTYPVLDNKRALMRAYKQTCIVDGDGDPWIEPNELPQLLVNIVYFNKLYAAFKDMDTDNDNRLDVNEFVQGAKKIGIKMTKRKLKMEFEIMDANNGGIVLFDEFCVWYTKQVNPSLQIADCTSKFVEKRNMKPKTLQNAFV